MPNKLILPKASIIRLVVANLIGGMPRVSRGGGSDKGYIQPLLSGKFNHVGKTGDNRGTT